MPAPLNRLNPLNWQRSPRPAQNPDSPLSDRAIAPPASDPPSATETPTQPPGDRPARRWPLWFLGALAIALGINAIARAWVEALWFQELDYSAVFSIRLLTRLLIFGTVSGTSLIFLWGNILLAERLEGNRRHWQQAQTRQRRKWWEPPQPPPPPPDDRDPNRILGGDLSLLPLALTVTGAGLSLGLMALHYGHITWQTLWPDAATTVPPVPDRFAPMVVIQLLQTLWTAGAAPALLGGLVLSAIATLMAPRLILRCGAIVTAIAFGLISSHHWSYLLQALYGQPFGITDPLFGADISFYVFTLPLLNLVEFWAIGLLGFGILFTLLAYLLAGRSLSEGRFEGVNVQELRHLSGLLGNVLAATGVSFALSGFELLYAARRVTYGAGFTDVWVRLPLNGVLACLGLLLALSLQIYALTGRRLGVWLALGAVHLGRRPTADLARSHPRVRTILGGVMAYAIAAVFLVEAVPETVQRLIVQPNELARERPYIARNIEYTRRAFRLDQMETREFDPGGNLTYEDLLQDEDTVRNIRLWDTRPLLETNRQLQQIRPYYRFADGDIDRYLLPKMNNPDAIAPTVPRDRQWLQQVILSARELDTESLPERARTWVNQHLVYTHGYGFTLSPVNEAGPGGLPKYFVSDIGTERAIAQPALPANLPPSPALDANAEPVIPAALPNPGIPTDRPRIYYGELANTYAIAPTLVDELDYPSGSDNAYNHYAGEGGIPLHYPWQRWLFATYLRDWQMLFSRSFTPDTKVLLRRNITQRLRAIAPFLRYDNDPYMVTVNLPPNSGFDDQHHLYWIADAYTTSDRYPYSEPGEGGFNYMRNSVKAVIDAHSGTTRFYITDPDDPIIRAWRSIFPKLFLPFEAMPAPLRSHVRYGNDFFKVQSERLLIYHMTDPQVFYNREDLWEVPQELYGTQMQPVTPYYAILRLPGERSPEFVQLLPFSPVSRNNLVAWLAARSDGDRYGKLRLYNFPKDRLVFGIEQVEARINQEPDISEQISLWNRQGSRAIQGNLLVLPIGRSLLYVEPLYLSAEEKGLPTLARVIAVHNDRIAMRPTLDEALQAVLSPEAPVLRRRPGATPATDN
jgi:uncharacterized membrane protein (UPF0182 family)